MVSSGRAVERFTAALAGAGAEVVAVFVLVDMRDVADTVTSLAPTLTAESVSTYVQLLALATANGLLDPAVHRLSVDASVNRWTEDDPRWELLPTAARLAEPACWASGTLRMRRTSISGAAAAATDRPCDRGAERRQGHRLRACS